MTDYRSYGYNSAGPSHIQPAESMMQRTLTQHTHHSVADSTVSWVQNHPSRPTLAPRPIDTPPVVQRLRPLPNPHPQAPIQRPFHVVNVPDTPKEAEKKDTSVDGRRMGLEGNSAEGPSTPSAGFARPQKKKSSVGGFVKRIRRLPKTVFGYGAGSDRSKFQRSGTPTTEATSTSVTGNTLPPYSSNPPTPSVAPGRSGLRTQYTPGLLISPPTEPPIPESPPPDVVRLSSNRVSDLENVRLGPDTLSRKPTNEFPQADRATVMLYHEPNSRYYEDDLLAPRPVPPAISRQPSSGAALSYVEDPVPFQPVRPLSFHSTHTALPPLEIPKRVPTPGPNGPRVSYVSQAPPPPRTTPLSLIPGSHPSPSPPTQLELQTVPASVLQQPPPQHIQSPVTAHPKHTADYRKMTSSPAPTSHNTFATGSSYYDPSFSSQLSPVERFFTTLYRMPWISHNRVTVDYLPGAGAGMRRKRKMKPIASWYRSVMSRSSRNNSGSIDALSNGTVNSPRSNLRASLAMILGSPRSSDRHKTRRRRSHDELKDHHSRRHRRHSSRRHRRHHSHSDTDRRRTATSMDTTDTKDGYLRKESSPLIPSMYPYQYPPYPYPSIPTFPVPAVPVSATGDEDLSQVHSTKERHKRASPRGPRGVPQQSPMFYAPGYASYQPMIAPPLPPPPHVYFLQSPISPTYGGAPAAVPPVLVPGGVHESGHAHGVQPGGGQGKLQPALAPSGAGSGQSVPGAFST